MFTSNVITHVFEFKLPYYCLLSTGSIWSVFFSSLSFHPPTLLPWLLQIYRMYYFQSVFLLFSFVLVLFGVCICGLKVFVTSGKFHTTYLFKYHLSYSLALYLTSSFLENSKHSSLKVSQAFITSDLDPLWVWFLCLISLGLWSQICVSSYYMEKYREHLRLCNTASSY